MKRRIITILAAVTLTVSAAGISAFAADMDRNSVSGGWAESTGYYTDGVPGTTDVYTSGTSAVWISGSRADMDVLYAGRVYGG